MGVRVDESWYERMPRQVLLDWGGIFPGDQVSRAYGLNATIEDDYAMVLKDHASWFYGYDPARMDDVVDLFHSV
jgi:hypothetical protein